MFTMHVFNQTIIELFIRLNFYFQKLQMKLKDVHDFLYSRIELNYLHDLFDSVWNSNIYLIFVILAWSS